MQKSIILGITGGIAAYKLAEVASALTKKGYDVNTVMTEAATKFIQPLTFRTITRNPVETDLFSPPAHYDVKHISLAKKADLILVAPITANFIGKIAGGIADDLLSTIIMAATAPVLISPAMNENMYNNKIVQDNLKYLLDNDYQIIEPESGYLACGDSGKGRLPEPEFLIEIVEGELTPSDFKGKKMLITAGPTREPVDPVRFLSNYSSGKMGFALARAASYRGAEVSLISGPTNLQPPRGIEFITVETAVEMQKEIKQIAPQQNIIIMAAAVADFRPVSVKDKKIKKELSKFNEIKLEKNPDILSELGHKKKENQLLIGFAAESDNLLENAAQKLKKKNLDLIAANDISDREIGFNSDENKVTLLGSDFKKELPQMNKLKLSHKLLDYIKKRFL